MLNKVLFGFFRALAIVDIMQPICNRFECRRIKEASILGMPAKRRWYHLKGDTNDENEAYQKQAS